MLSVSCTLYYKTLSFLSIRQRKISNKKQQQYLILLCYYPHLKTNSFNKLVKIHFQILKLATNFNHFLKLTHLSNILNPKAPKKLLTAAKETKLVFVADPSSKATKRLYVENIPRTITYKELIKIVEEHGATEKKSKIIYELMSLYF